MTNKLERTGYDYLPVPGEPYHPMGKPTSAGEVVTVLKEDAVNALIKDSDGQQHVVPKDRLRR